MNKDVRLLNDTLEVFKKVRQWLPPEYYKETVMPIVNQIKERLAIVETELFMKQRALNYEHYSKKVEEEKEPDTVPSQLLDIQSQFGIFKDTE